MNSIARNTSTAAALYSQCVEPEIIAALENWGAWHSQMAPKMATRTGLPKYLEVVRMPTEPRHGETYDDDQALMFDKLIGELNDLEVKLLILKYSARYSSRVAADQLSIKGTKCSHTTFRRWVEQAEIHLEDLVFLQTA